MGNKKIGRPQKEINQTEFENLCQLQCTMLEICGFFEISDKTLTKWCKKVYGLPFSEVFKIKRSKGKISLRRTQFEMAQKNANMAIWLGKQWLGQTENPEADEVIEEVPTEIQINVVDGSKDEDENEEDNREQ